MSEKISGNDIYIVYTFTFKRIPHTQRTRDASLVEFSASTCPPFFIKYFEII